MFEDRRRQKRVGVSLPIRVKGLDSRGNRFDELTKSIDVSSDGVSFLLKAPVQRGALLDLSLPLPRQLQRSVVPKTVYETIGRVIRVEESSAPGSSRVAVKFRAADIKQYRAET